MKKLTLLFLLIACAINSSAQDASAEPQPEPITTGLKRGYQAFAEAGYAAAVGDWGISLVTVSTSHGFQFNPNIYLGLGLGLHFAVGGEEMTDGDTFLPIFADFRWTMIKKRVTPFMGVRFGGIAAIDSYYADGGIHCNPSIGVRIGTRDDNAINVSLGYIYNQLTIGTYSYWGYYTYHADCGSFGWRVGFEF